MFFILFFRQMHTSKKNLDADAKAMKTLYLNIPLEKLELNSNMKPGVNIKPVIENI